MTDHGERQREDTWRICGMGMEILEHMVGAADRGDFRAVSDISARFAKSLIDLSRAALVTDTLEKLEVE